MRPSVFSLLACGALLSAPFARAADSAEELIRKGDAAYDRLQTKEALSYYVPAEKLDPKNARLLVHMSREYRHLMTDASGKEEKLRLGSTALDYANRAVALSPNDPESQLAVAITLGRLQPLQSTGDRLAASRIIKSAADKAIRLDPKNDLAWHILGRWNMAFAEVSSVKRALARVTYGELPQTTYADAAKCFEKAMALNSNRLMHPIGLGRAYAQMGRQAEAKKLINKGLAMKETEKDDPETKREGRETLAKLP